MSVGTEIIKSVFLNETTNFEIVFGNKNQTLLWNVSKKR